MDATILARFQKQLVTSAPGTATNENRHGYVHVAMMCLRTCTKPFYVLNMSKRARNTNKRSALAGPYITWRERVLLLLLLQLQRLLSRIIIELQAVVPAVIPAVEDGDDYEGFPPV